MKFSGMTRLLRDNAVHGCVRGILFAATLAFLSISSTAFAADTAKPAQLPAPIIAIIDVQRIMQESLAAKSVQQQLESQRAKFQTEISGEESELRQAEQDLAKSRETSAPDVYADHEQQLRQRFLTEERNVQARRKALDQAFTDSMGVVRKNMLEVVAAVATSHGANIVIVKQQAMWSDKNMDITDEVLTKIDKTLPQVQVRVVPDDGGGDSKGKQ